MAYGFDAATAATTTTTNNATTTTTTTTEKCVGLPIGQVAECVKEAQSEASEAASETNASSKEGSFLKHMNSKLIRAQHFFKSKKTTICIMCRWGTLSGQCGLHRCNQRRCDEGTF